MNRIIQDKIINMLKETDPDETKYFKSFIEESVYISGNVYYDIRICLEISSLDLECCIT